MRRRSENGLQEAQRCAPVGGPFAARGAGRNAIASALPQCIRPGGRTRPDRFRDSPPLAHEVDHTSRVRSTCRHASERAPHCGGHGVSRDPSRLPIDHLRGVQPMCLGASSSTLETASGFGNVEQCSRRWARRCRQSCAAKGMLAFPACRSSDRVAPFARHVRRSATPNTRDGRSLPVSLLLPLPPAPYCASHKNWTLMHQHPMQIRCFIGSEGGACR